MRAAGEQAANPTARRRTSIVGPGAQISASAAKISLKSFLIVYELIEPVGYYETYDSRLDKAARKLAKERDPKMIDYRLNDMYKELLALGELATYARISG